MNPLQIVEDSPDTKNRKKIWEKDSSNDDLISKISIFKTVQENSKFSVLVPKWLVWLMLFGLLTLFTILLAALLMALFSRKPGLYLEDCKFRSCAPNLNLKCIDQICNCTENQYFLKGCHEKKDHLKLCQLQMQCKSNLMCRGGACNCNESDYWNGNMCVARHSYNEMCLSEQCLESSFLFCSSSSNVCLCPQNRFISPIKNL